jgi:hypothetical protein
MLRRVVLVRTDISEKLGSTRATRRNIPEDGIPQLFNSSFNEILFRYNNLCDLVVKVPSYGLI